MSESTVRLADLIAPNALVASWYLNKTISDIPAAQFARKPQGMNMNHPAWVMGHLTIYPDMALQLIGRGDLTESIEGAAELFDAGTECRDDPDGAIYPSKDELIARFDRRTKAAAAAYAEADNATLTQPNTLFLQKELPTIGGLASFLLGQHVMTHAGQLSSWRRAMGMGPCM